jgi:hypothetical protein
MGHPAKDGDAPAFDSGAKKLSTSITPIDRAKRWVRNFN